MNTLKAIKDQVILRKEPGESQTGGGLVLPQNHIDQEWWYQVVASGPEVEDIQPGDTVMLNPGGLGQIRFNGEDLFHTKQSDDKIIAKAWRD